MKNKRHLMELFFALNSIAHPDIANKFLIKTKRKWPKTMLFKRLQIKVSKTGKLPLLKQFGGNAHTRIIIFNNYDLQNLRIQYLFVSEMSII